MLNEDLGLNCPNPAPSEAVLQQLLFCQRGVVPRQPLAGRCQWPWEAALKWLIVQIKLILLLRLFVTVRHLHREVPVDLPLAMLSQQD